MTMAYSINHKYKNKLVSTIHNADNTCRPQVLESSQILTTITLLMSYQN